MAPRIGAFFDVDKTIIAENSGALYLRALYERGEIDWQALLLNLGSYLKYKLNLLNVERWTESTMQHFKGRSESEMAAEALDWFAEYVQPVIYPEARELVADHLARDHVVALVSASNRLVVQPLADYLGVEHIMCTHLQVHDGLYTGRVLQPLCFGEGKIYWLQQLLERENLDLAKSYFYTDSISDQPLLDVVGHPVVVNPDPLLYREARRRRWPVRAFSAPSPPREGEPASALH